MKTNQEWENILDQATSEMRNEELDSVVVKQAAERVWARIAAENRNTSASGSHASETIENCGDFQSLIPAYLNGELSESRSLLLVDHTHECIPCRKAMKLARERNVMPLKKAAG